MGVPSDVLQRKYAYFHSNSKTLIEENQNNYESFYNSAHITLLKHILADQIPVCMTTSAADEFCANNPHILKKYDKISLTEVSGSNGQTYYINDSKWIKPFITESLISDSNTNLPSNGFTPRLWRGDSGAPISPTSGIWWIDPFQGIVKFQSGYTPSILGWGTPKLTVYAYVGRTLDEYLLDIQPKVYKYTSSSQTVIHRLNHNFNTYDVVVDILVKDPITGRWAKEYVGIEYVDTNNIDVLLTISSYIKATVQLV